MRPTLARPFPPPNQIHGSRPGSSIHGMAPAGYQEELHVAQEQDLRNSPGWQAWNMSKRVSAANGYEREANEILEALVSAGEMPDDTLTQAGRLASEISDAATRSRATWQRIQEAIRKSDPSIMDESDSQVSVLSHRGANHALAAQIRTIWGEDDGVSVAYWKFQELKALTTPPENAPEIS